MGEIYATEGEATARYEITLAQLARDIDRVIRWEHLRLLEGESADGSSIPTGSGPWGHSWTDVDPFQGLADPRGALGLPTGPDGNPARFLSVGELRDPTGVTRRSALPLDGNPGGASELLIPDPENQIELKGIYGVNPEP